jgi:hypothetical protein
MRRASRLLDLGRRHRRYPLAARRRTLLPPRQQLRHHRLGRFRPPWRSFYFEDPSGQTMEVLTRALPLLSPGPARS